jgi:hypothetical protein
VSLPRRLVPLLIVTALVGSVAMLPAGASAGADATVSKAKAKAKKCPKGKKLVTVTKKGKKVRVCKKKKTPSKACARAKSDAAASCVLPPPPPLSPSLFEAPGQKLEGEAAKPFLQKYLLNSTFTDCVTGWPSCGGFEDRYSHWADNSFYMCLLKISSGSDVKSVGEYGVTNARIEPDGSWIFQEVVAWYGYHSAFEWRVSTTGVVEGAYQSTAGSGTPEKIGPLQYIHTPKDCSY